MATPHVRRGGLTAPQIAQILNFFDTRLPTPVLQDESVILDFVAHVDRIDIKYEEPPCERPCVRDATLVAGKNTIVALVSICRTVTDSTYRFSTLALAESLAWHLIHYRSRKIGALWRYDGCLDALRGLHDELTGKDALNDSTNGQNSRHAGALRGTRRTVK